MSTDNKTMFIVTNQPK